MKTISEKEWSQLLFWKINNHHHIGLCGPEFSGDQPTWAPWWTRQGRRSYWPTWAHSVPTPDGTAPRTRRSEPRTPLAAGRTPIPIDYLFCMICMLCACSCPSPCLWCLGAPRLRSPGDAGGSAYAHPVLGSRRAHPPTCQARTNGTGTPRQTWTWSRATVCCRGKTGDLWAKDCLHCDVQYL